MGDAGVAGAGEGNRTLVISLEGFCSTIELHPRIRLTEGKTVRIRGDRAEAPRVGESVPCLLLADPLVEGEGFEPSKAEPADLQSAPFDRSGTPPTKHAILAVFVPAGQTGSERCKTQA